MMPDIVEYKVVYVYDMLKKNGVKLQEAVNREIESGWVPIGGVSVNLGQFAQAMVKYNKE